MRPGGLSVGGSRPVTSSRLLRTSLTARIETIKDPHDLYRIWLPARGRLTISVNATAPITLALWGPKTSSLSERGLSRRRDLLAKSQHAASKTQTLSLSTQRARAAYGYLELALGPRTRAASYTLKISSSVRR